mmetsp:Transcript_14795/g.31866  ORF Transcript_14795/g.31866 Transcript_14795/m.31866 type:complete len:440 (-) Transcript_14795:116-1435(-)
MDALTWHSSVLPPASSEKCPRERRKVANKTTLCNGTAVSPRPTKVPRLWCKRLQLTTSPLNNCGAESQIINLLPNAIISNILFGFLDQSPKQLSTIRSVCTSFHSMARASFRKLHLRPDITKEVDLILTHSLTNNIINQFLNLKEVDFSYCANFDDYRLELLSPLINKLRVLKLRGTRITDGGVMKLFGYEDCLKWCDHVHQRSATTIDINMKQNLTNAKNEIKSCPSASLEVLDLSENGITNKSLLAVAYTCLELKRLSLSMCAGITDDFLDSVPLFLVNLTSLDLSHSSVTSRGCCHLARLPSLQSVDISACTALRGRCIEALITGRHPHIFLACDYDEFDIIDEDQFIIQQQLGLARETESLSQLTSIGARYANGGIDDNLLNTLATYAPNLHTLDLRHYRGNDLKTGCLSPMKMSLRKLRQNGMKVAFTRCDVMT